MAKRAIAYIDGHNFYHGCMKDCPDLKWLNIEKFCARLLRGYKLLQINYYTATVIDFPEDPTQSQRQDTYNRALAALPLVDIIRGQFQINEKPVRLLDGTRARARVPEEKGSDVNLGTDLSWDAARDEMDAVLVISNDFDLQRPIRRAMAADIEVIIVNPHRYRKRGEQRGTTGTNKPLSRLPAVKGSDTRKVTERLLRQCQLPDIVLGLDGAELHRPALWR